MKNEPIEVTLRVTGVLEELAVPYVIGGSLASTLHGMVRTTQDSDIITGMRPEHISSFVSSLRNEFFIDEEMIADLEIGSILLYSIRRGSSQGFSWRMVS
jgi:hypothetical protein